MDAVKIPADIDLEDRLAFGLTAKQLAILAGAGLSGYGAYTLLVPLAPRLVAAAAGGVVVIGGLLLALISRDGLDGQQLALAATRFLLAPKRQALAPGGVPGRYPRAPRQPRTCALDVPVRRVLRSGLVERRDAQHVQLLEANGTSFELRSDNEKHAYAAALGQLLKSLTEPIQIRVGSEPVKLDRLADQIQQQTSGRAAGLQQSAAGLAGFLRELGQGGQLRRLRISLVLTSRERDPQQAQLALARRAGEAAELLRGAEVELRPLDGEQAGRLLASTLDAPGPLEGSELTGVIHAQAQQETNSRARGGRSGGGAARPRRRPRRNRQGQSRGALAAHPGGDRLPT